jgi:hypothetical protein
MVELDGKSTLTECLTCAGKVAEMWSDPALLGTIGHPP